MAVIALPNISPQGPGGPHVEWELRSNTAIQRSPFNSATTTLERAGAVWAATLRYQNLDQTKAGRLNAFLSACRGHGSRFYLYDFSRTSLRGSFPTSELLTNNTFTDGTAGWSGVAGATLSVSDNGLRVRRSDSTANYQVSRTGVAVTQYAPHIARALLLQGQGFSALTTFVDDGVTAKTGGGAPGLNSVAIVPLATTVQFAAYEATATGGMAGDFFRVAYTSLSRCALVDNGPNLLQRSDELDDAYWTKTRATILGNSQTAPDGTATAERIVEDSTASETHLVERALTVSSASLEYCFTVTLKAGTRSWALLEVFEASTSMSAYFNLATGAVGTVNSGGNWSHRRTFVTPMGDGWYRCTILGLKTGSATTLTATIQLATGDGVASYSGDGASYISAWRVTLSQSSVPSVPALTTSAATTGSGHTGGVMRVKGLPVSTNGLLLPGDWFEVITPAGSEFKKVTAAMDSDAAGLGYLQFEPTLRSSPADGAAVIIQRPMCRFMLDSNIVRWAERHGGFSDLEFTAVEDVVPV